MDSSKIKLIFVAIVATFAALYLGIAAATAQIESIAWVVGGVVVTVCLLLGRRVFLLIPLMTSLELLLPLPGNFSTGLISQGLVLGFATLLFLIRRLPMRGGFSELEAWCLLLFLTVVQAYVRNPVGLSIMGSGSVGAKPYFVFGVTTVTALLLSLLVIDPKDLRTWVRLSFLGSILNFAVGSIAFVFPHVGYYMGATFAQESNEGQIAGRASRIVFVRNISVALATWVSSRISPLIACFHPIWLPVTLLSLACAGLSGYRSQLILVGLLFFVGICYRGGIRSALAASFMGAIALAMLVFVNLVAPLPINIQRSLSFLPGVWDQSLKSDGETSTQWRIDMWKEALLTDRWITNKWLGDGLGFTKEELERMLNFQEANKGAFKGRTGMTISQEGLMIAGAYHSGPVSTVRTTGYVGLAVLLMAMFRLAVHAHRQIQRSRHTEWFSVALFLGIPIVAAPIFWTVVFGTFGEGVSGVMMGAAVIRLLEKNLPLPAYVPGRRVPFSIPQQRAALEQLAMQKQ